MTLHIFNPEHDISLASGLANFTAPHAGRQLRHDLGFLPIIWADEGDAILVDDADQALRAATKLNCRMKNLLGGRCMPSTKWLFVQNHEKVKELHDIQPWGWNSALRATLLRQGYNEHLMPAKFQLDFIRELSHRRTAASLLPKLRMPGTIGEAYECREAKQVESLLAQYGQVVMKSPWSSSGRGLRFLSVERTPFSMQSGWFHHVVQAQGSVMVEPYYNKVRDFGMEFFANRQGDVRYLGLSLFHTANGAYIGNIIATEVSKQSVISHYIPTELLNDIKERICRETSILLKGKYQGPFGVDMMVVKPDSSRLLLHPCVEINLRRTMGHVALALTPADDDICCVMRIHYSNIYQLHIDRL